MHIVECKHCGEPLVKRGADYFHASGPQEGKHTCAIEPYGFHAEPVGTRCGAHPANPCNGARGMEPEV